MPVTGALFTEYATVANRESVRQRNVLIMLPESDGWHC